MLPNCPTLPLLACLPDWWAHLPPQQKQVSHPTGALKEIRLWEGHGSGPTACRAAQLLYAVQFTICLVMADFGDTFLHTHPCTVQDPGPPRRPQVVPNAPASTPSGSACLNPSCCNSSCYSGSVPNAGHVGCQARSRTPGDLLLPIDVIKLHAP
jgi:hypothetical protein